jgi:uncharacterized membrane protein YkvA (DUF1232 family)
MGIFRREVKHMSELDEKCLNTFPNWLASIPSDVGAFLEAAKTDGIGEETKRTLLGGINYLFKSLDLIPDEVEDLGYLDDAFVLRLSAKSAIEQGLGNVSAQTKSKLEALAADVALIVEFLSADVYKRLVAYTAHLRNGAARGRMVDELMEKPALFAELVDETKTFIATFKAPEFKKDEKNLIKLAAFFEARLPK